VSKEKRRRAVAALIRCGGTVIPVSASEKAEKIAREGREFFTEWLRRK
jgi:hypothetical protein